MPDFSIALSQKEIEALKRAFPGLSVEQAVAAALAEQVALPRPPVLVRWAKHCVRLVRRLTRL